ncbi:hypothetical protein [Bacteroides sp. 224]|uniref:hypothetical protein n=1 Tax=Bacteroides sp. 224 TaxID=2302936 RepID=UPI0013D1CF72|nr:hypothetical protein [Bacteroides sp. 224]NDV66970.1 hypothetical protein [Bacteroides sp. 224]
MKLIKSALILLVAFVALSAFSLKKQKTVYAFGFSDSFTDTVVYCTEIQVLDSVTLKKGFLPQRDLYSYQLKNYLEYQKGERNRTCMIYFSEDKNKLAKEKANILNKYKKRKVVLKEIAIDAFSFKKPEE